jgi:hypothetical protein
MSQAIYIILLLCTTSGQGCTLDQDELDVYVSGYFSDHVTVCRIIDQREAECYAWGTFKD